jgi:tetratricopeptide (TPR) repeat protein
MDNISFFENQFIKADTMISEGNVSEAKAVLEEILAECPDFGKAHNHLGWIYCMRLSNYEKAEYHYKLAIKFDPKYPAPYINYTYLLVDLARYTEAKDFIFNVMGNIEGIDKSSYFSELGRISEFETNYIQAYQYYKKALNLAFSKTLIDNMNANMLRVKDKMSTFEKLKLNFI